MTKELCGICAIKLRESGMEVKQVGGRMEKISCQECGKRKYGTTYEVTAKKAAKNHDKP